MNAVDTENLFSEILYCTVSEGDSRASNTDCTIYLLLLRSLE
jgi:hypothetical protein